MNVEDFEGCCTARIFTDLGDSRTSEFGYHAASYEKLRNKIVNAIEVESEGGAGIITAIVTNEQVTGAKVLKDLGFIGTGMASKTCHSQVQIELYYLHCKDWVEPEKPADIVAPEVPVAAPQPFAAARNPIPQPVRRHGLRDDRGRFVSRNEQRGYVTRLNSWGLTHVEQVTHSRRGACQWTRPNGPAKIFTKSEYDELEFARLGNHAQEIFFQPI